MSLLEHDEGKKYVFIIIFLTCLELTVIYYFFYENDINTLELESG